jgi:Ca-dependent carbohydrate-binding module xylan-binding
VIIAAGDMAGSELPRLAIYIDRDRIAAISISTGHYSEYSVIVPISDGQHRCEFIFENDFIDPSKREDRNIRIKKVLVKYLPALIVQDTEPNGRYAVDYLASDLESKTYYSQFVRERHRNGQLGNLPITSVPLDDDLRRSLVLAGGDKTEFPVLFRIPVCSSLVSLVNHLMQIKASTSL